MNVRSLQHITSLLLLLPLGILAQPEKPQITADDLSKVIGHWEGTLTYIDYSTNEPYTMPAHLDLKQGKKTMQLSGFHSYPYEPKANSSFALKVTKKGTLINKNKVVSKYMSPEGILLIIAEHAGKDGNDNKKATIRITYSLGPTTYSVKKEVRFIGSSEWLMRNEYRYERK